MRHITQSAPTLGNDAEAHEGIGMTDVRGRQPRSNKPLHAMPRQMIALTTPAQDLPPQATDRPPCQCEMRHLPWYLGPVIQTFLNAYCKFP